MINVKVSRNDLCPCGSGKKYKKCCGAHEAVSITQMVENEIEDLQKQILHYTLDQYEVELINDYEDLEQVITIDDEQSDFYQFVHAIWFSFFWELDDDEHIIDRFIESESRKIKRPRLREILQTWTKARTVTGKVIEINGNIYTVENGFTGERMDVVFTNMIAPSEIGAFFLAVILPYDQKYVFFPAPFDLQNLEPQFAFDYIKQRSIENGYDTPEEYLNFCFLEIMNEIPMLDQMGIDDLDWPAPIYQEVAQVFQNRLEEQGNPKTVIDTGILLWHQFCLIKQKRIQNTMVYVAAIHYLLSCIVPLEKEYTQKGTAEMYGVSVGTMSSIFREMFDALEPEIRKMQSIIQEEEPFPAPAPAPKKVKQKDLEKKQKAQELIYEAYEAEGDERYELAEQAIKLHTHCVDAYLILAERARSKEEALVYYERAILGGEFDLGWGFFEENKGYFWGLIETRPYMRAKFQFAETLYQLGRVKEAVEQYEEMMNLNPNDNQGVRYSLFAGYMDLGNYSKARRLLQQYKEGTAHDRFNLLLLELLDNGFTLKAEKLLKDAKKENKYVIDYLTGKKSLPDTLPDYYGIGDENEAIVYADIHLHLWKKIDGVREWLKRK